MNNKLWRLSQKHHYLSVIGDAEYVIRKALSYSSKVAVGVSGGKDSTALAHLVSRFCDPLLIWNNSGLELPESKDIVERLADKLGCELIEAKGQAIKLWMDKDKSIDKKSIQKPIMDVLRKHSIDLEFVGLRENEAKHRRIIIRKYGPIHFNKSWNCWTAWPMRKWLGEDCLAYIDEFDLPLHPAYTRTEWGNKKAHDIRVSWVYDDDWDTEGSAEYCRRYYPEIYNNLKVLGVIK